MESFYDLSEYMNQVFLGFKIAEIFTVVELEQIQCNIINFADTRDINDPFEFIYDRLFKSNNRFQIVDLITNINNHHERCIDIRMKKNYNIETIVKCIFDKKFNIYLSNAVCLAINYLKYGTFEDKKYSAMIMAAKYATLAEALSCDGSSIENCKRLIEYLTIMNDESSDIYTNYHFIKEFNEGNCTYTISIVNPTMLKFSVFNIDKLKAEYIFIPRNKTGLEILMYIGESILQNYRLRMK